MHGKPFEVGEGVVTVLHKPITLQVVRGSPGLLYSQDVATPASLSIYFPDQNAVVLGGREMAKYLIRTTVMAS